MKNKTMPLFISWIVSSLIVKIAVEVYLRGHGINTGGYVVEPLSVEGGLILLYIVLVSLPLLTLSRHYAGKENRKAVMIISSAMIGLELLWLSIYAIRLICGLIVG